MDFNRDLLIEEKLKEFESKFSQNTGLRLGLSKKVIDNPFNSYAQIVSWLNNTLLIVFQVGEKKGESDQKMSDAINNSKLH